MKLVRVKYVSPKGKERNGIFIKTLKGYIPIRIEEHFEEIKDPISEEEIELNEFTAKIKK